MTRLVLFIQLLVLMLGSTLATASTRRAVDIPERARGAQKVVVARATHVAPMWRQNVYGDQLIVSQVTLQVEEVLKGTAGSALSVEVEGGTIGGITLKVSSQSELRPGERAVFFLNPAGNGAHVPHLKGHGVLKLGSDNVVTGSSLHLDDIRKMTKDAGR